MTLSARKCPICGKPRREEHTPFCSQRCRDRDLVRWLDDGYAVPGAWVPSWQVQRLTGVARGAAGKGSMCAAFSPTQSRWG